MEICRDCLKKYDGSTNQKQGDQCTEKNCGGKIIELEDIMEPILVALRKKHYTINLMITGEFVGAGFIIGISPYQCTEHFPAFPKGFTKNRYHDSVMLIRKLTNTDPEKRHQEVLNIIDEVLEWINKLPVVRVLITNLYFPSKSETEKPYNELLKKGIFFDLNITEPGKGHYSIDGYRTIKEDDSKNEVGSLFNYYEKSGALYIVYYLLPESPLKGIENPVLLNGY